MTRPSPRAVALELVTAVLDRRQPLDAALESSVAITALEPRDRAFARLIVGTVLRRLGQIDAAIAVCLDKPLQAKARLARNLLRTGAAQLLFLRTPAHAAVDSTVALASGAQLAPYRGLINAVLRRLARGGADLVATQDAPRLNLPDWLWEAWRRDYGEAAVRAIAAVQEREPPLDLSVVAEPDDWAARLGALRLPTGTLRLSHAGLIKDLPGYDQGAWWVQDAAAALPARLFGDVRGAAVVDLCAAPGGKAMQLAAAGACVVAVDRSQPRMTRLQENARRTALNIRTVVADAARWQPEVPTYRVLLDAPCSSTGTLRRHPDVAWLKSQADVERMTSLQDALLDTASAMLAPGGTLVYCVCSLQREEGPDRVGALLARSDHLTRHPIDAGEIGGLTELITAEGDLRTLPCHLADKGGMDGFYAARLVRKD
ncbi:MAG TPA: transcription antitermination factor NusB [Alphaproteobacteria bacterium]|nr:transcription antitermination factor NusB [Alphaproteobacteria bacterium]